MSARKRGAAREVFRLQSSAVPRIPREGEGWAGADTQEGPSQSLGAGAGGDEVRGAGGCGSGGRRCRTRDERRGERGK